MADCGLCPSCGNGVCELALSESCDNCEPDCGPCVTCGNGAFDATEVCDDGNTQAGDGCDADCQLESGWNCVGEPSVCVENATGNPVSFATDVQPIFTAHCAGTACHGPPAPRLGLDVTSYSALATTAINQPASQAPLDNIEPGNLAASYLIHKLDGTYAAVGGSGGADAPKRQHHRASA